MKNSPCPLLRIRLGNEVFDVKEFIKSIENQHNIYINSLPQWKILVKRLYNYKITVEKATCEVEKRQCEIIEKLFIQNYRPSPFEFKGICNYLHETSKLRIKTSTTNGQKMEESIVGEGEENVSENLENNKLNTPQNTETLVTQSAISNKENINLNNTQENLQDNAEIHSLVADIENGRKLTNTPEDQLDNSEININNSLLLNIEYINPDYKESCNIIECCPKHLFLYRPSFNKCTRKITIINRYKEFVFIQFKNITEKDNFKIYKVEPSIPVKVYPGIPISFKFIFKINQNDTNFSGHIHFRVCKHVTQKGTTEVFSLPFIFNFTKRRIINIPKTVSIPPIYAWHLKDTIRHLYGILKIHIQDEFHYDMYVNKHVTNICQNSADNIETTQSPMSSKENQELLLEECVLKMTDPAPSTVSEIVDEENAKVFSDVRFVVYEIIDTALDTFIFEHSHYHLLPHSVHKVKFHLAKVDQAGLYQSEYDLIFYDSENNEFIEERTVLLLADILPNPVDITPTILDMSRSEVKHGQCRDVFTIWNKNKMCPVNVTIETDSVTKMLININPLKVMIPTSSKVNFEVHFCSHDLLLKKDERPESVHFTIKVILKGDSCIYHNCPPLYYEIIAPCATNYEELMKKLS